MIQLKEIRLCGSAPNMGVEVFANRRSTSTFLVGTEGVTGIMLDNGFITVATEKGMFGLPASACQWWKFAETEAKPEPKPDVKPEPKPPLKPESMRRQRREKESA